MLFGRNGVDELQQQSQTNKADRDQGHDQQLGLPVRIGDTVEVKDREHVQADELTDRYRYH